MSAVELLNGMKNKILDKISPEKALEILKYLSEFKNWAEDVPEECFGYLLEEWKKKTKDRNDLKEMNIFIEKECNNWAEWALKI